MYLFLNEVNYAVDLDMHMIKGKLEKEGNFVDPFCASPIGYRPYKIFLTDRACFL